MTATMTSRGYLECGHCGGPAIVSDDGTYWEDTSGPCITCGMPGRVSVDEFDDEMRAYWVESEDGRCLLPECDDPACDWDEPPPAEAPPEEDA